MVVRYLTNSTPMASVGLATKFDVVTIVREDEGPAPFDSFNINDYDCCYEELALADLSDDANWKNDKSSFLFKKSLATDSVDIELYKCEDGAEDKKADLNDNTYGEFFSAAYFGDSLRVGFILDWKLVLSAFGTGIYFVRANRDIINRNSVVETHKFRLLPYNEFTADETIRIETFSQGCIEGGIDYTGDAVEWQQMFRLRGKFWNQQPTFETDNYEDSNRNIQQIQDQITTQYNLDLEPVPADIAKPLIYDRLLANRIIITDYNLFNFCRYQNVEVYPVEISNAQYFNRSGNGLFSFVFTDKKQDIIKRNFL